MPSVPDKAVVLMYKPMHLPPPNANPLGLRPVSLQRLMSYCCGSAQANSCSVGERLVGACSHCVVALTLAGGKVFMMILPFFPFRKLLDSWSMVLGIYSQWLIVAQK